MEQFSIESANDCENLVHTKPPIPFTFKRNKRNWILIIILVTISILIALIIVILSAIAKANPTSPHFNQTPFHCPVLEIADGDYYCSNHTWQGSQCFLECQPGFSPMGGLVITCEKNGWIGVSSCSPSVAMLIGGGDVGYLSSHLSSVELYLSDGSCNGHLLNMPHTRLFHTSTIGKHGWVLVCGGHGSASQDMSAFHDQYSSCDELGENDQWFVGKKQMQKKRWDHTAEQIQGAVLLIGGGSGQGENDPSKITSEFV